jgi:hypothetical protein
MAALIVSAGYDHFLKYLEPAIRIMGMEIHFESLWYREGEILAANHTAISRK